MVDVRVRVFVLEDVDVRVAGRVFVLLPFDTDKAVRVAAAIPDVIIQRRGEMGHCQLKHGEIHAHSESYSHLVTVLDLVLVLVEVGELFFRRRMG